MRRYQVLGCGLEALAQERHRGLAQDVHDAPIAPLDCLLLYRLDGVRPCTQFLRKIRDAGASGKCFLRAHLGRSPMMDVKSQLGISGTGSL
jgi:hypothetical protein